VTTNVDLTDRVLTRREVDRVLDGESEAARVTPSPEEPQNALLTWAPAAVVPSLRRSAP